MNNGMHNINFKLRFTELVNSDGNKFETFYALTVCVSYIDDKRSSI